MVVLGNLIALLLSLPGALPMAMPAWKDLAVVAYLGCFQIGLAYWLLTRAIKRVPVFEASLILLLEPVSNPILVVAGPWRADGCVGASRRGLCARGRRLAGVELPRLTRMYSVNCHDRQPHRRSSGRACRGLQCGAGWRRRGEVGRVDRIHPLELIQVVHPHVGRRDVIELETVRFDARLGLANISLVCSSMVP